MKTYSSKEIIQLLKKDGWYLVNTVGSHAQYKHPSKIGKVTVPHPRKTLTIKTVKSIVAHAGIKL